MFVSPSRVGRIVQVESDLLNLPDPILEKIISYISVARLPQKWCVENKEIVEKLFSFYNPRTSIGALDSRITHVKKALSKDLEEFLRACYSLRDFALENKQLCKTIQKDGESIKDAILKDAAQALMRGYPSLLCDEMREKLVSPSNKISKIEDLFFLKKELLRACWTLDPKQIKSAFCFPSSLPVSLEKDDIIHLQNFFEKHSVSMNKLSPKDLVNLCFFYSCTEANTPSENIKYFLEASTVQEPKIKECVLRTVSCLAARHEKVDEIIPLIMRNRDDRSIILDSILVGSKTKGAFLRNLEILTQEENRSDSK